VKLRTWIKWDLLLVAFIAALVLFFQVDKPFRGYTRINLVAGCQFGIYDPALESTLTVVFECPRMDTIRLFPFPITSPWFEDPLKWPGEIWF